MNDPYDDEMRAQFRQPIHGLLASLKKIVLDLETAAQSNHPQDIKDTIDNAMNWLFCYLNQMQPIAFRRQKNGRTGFLWIEGQGTPHNSFHWMVCRDGKCLSGTERTQEDCERNCNLMMKGGEQT